MGFSLLVLALDTLFFVDGWLNCVCLLCLVCGRGLSFGLSCACSFSLSLASWFGGFVLQHLFYCFCVVLPCCCWLLIFFALAISLFICAFYCRCFLALMLAVLLTLRRSCVLTFVGAAGNVGVQTFQFLMLLSIGWFTTNQDSYLVLKIRGVVVVVGLVLAEWS